MQEVVNVLAKEFTDPKSLFLGMFISIVSVEIFSKLSSMDRLKIKMPDSVPDCTQLHEGIRPSADEKQIRSWR